MMIDYKQLRKDRGLKQCDVAKAIGVDRGLICKIEHGLTPGYRTLCKLNRLLDLPIPDPDDRSQSNSTSPVKNRKSRKSKKFSPDSERNRGGTARDRQGLSEGRSYGNKEDTVMQGTGANPENLSSVCDAGV